MLPEPYAIIKQTRFSLPEFLQFDFKDVRLLLWTSCKDREEGVDGKHRPPLWKTPNFGGLFSFSASSSAKASEKTI
ncbi:hypothetical protein CEXT_215641 [Caerostris extrusa]|uniref:Uncharacterized protein n=1 Tax=Caerostris extrusa TaxID=172846 RepID=A0AAV4U4D9_CAEEX|nr:hypothetical protein CEXT_215641 [Caerostris extrusa]